MAEPIRVWLEPGWDRGRVAAWMLDLPGCFTWGETREVALAHVPSAVGAFASWLEEHDERIQVPQTDELAVVEEVATVAPPDGRREAQATFAADRAAVPDAVLADATRRLELSQADLLGLAARVRDHEARHDPVPARAWTDAAGRERIDEPAEAVLRHVAWGDVLMGSRLDRSRLEGGLADDPVEAINASLPWLADRLRAQHAAGLGEITDGAGETWTLAKVVRRAIAHRLDHLGELDRRLARAERAVERVVIRRDVLVEAERLAELFRAVGWYRRVADHGRLARMLEGSTQMVSAWDGERMIGFARAISDDAFNGYIGSVAVHPRWQGKGLGQRLIRELLEGNDQVRFMLSAVPGLEGFYESIGFRREEHAMYRPRLR